ncbi:MAG: hypothetical protein QMD61_10370 [Methanobacterium sp.]|nr:hypothetical protein [Methanobacterium sp.]
MVKGKLGVPKMKSTHSRGASSCQSKVVGKESPFKEAICEICDKVFKTDGDIYICPECQEKARNICQ